MSRLLWSAAGLLIVVNSVVLAHAYYNRHEAQAHIILNERELNPPGNYGFQKDNSGISLAIQWNVLPDEPDHEFLYSRSLQLSAEHYTTFGFARACSQQFSNTDKQGFVLFEFNGNTHLQVVEKARAALNNLQQSGATGTPKHEAKIKEARDNLEQLELKHSRLYVIDAAATKTTLQTTLSKQPKIAGSQFLILPAIIRDNYRNCDTKQKDPYTIYIDDILVDRIYVPREYHPLFSDKKNDLHFQATIAFGKMDEPWLESLIVCEKECKAQ